MLLSFKLKNYKSFIDGAKLDMTKKPKQTELDYSILEENCKKNQGFVFFCYLWPERFWKDQHNRSYGCYEGNCIKRKYP